MTREKSAWEKLPNDKKRSMQQQAEDLVSGRAVKYLDRAEKAAPAHL